MQSKDAFELSRCGICALNLQSCMHACVGSKVMSRAELHEAAKLLSYRKATHLQASGKQCSLFNRPISSPASYDDLGIDSDQEKLAPSPRHSKHQLSLRSIPEVAM